MRILHILLGQLIANNRGLLQKPLVLTFLLIVAISGIVLFSGINISLTNNNNDNQAQAQGQQQQPKVGQTSITKLWETLNVLKNPESVAMHLNKMSCLFLT